jgi:hypothetical protein
MRRRAAAMLLSGVAVLAFVVDASHITDKMAVGLRESPNDERPKRLLISGTPLEVLDRAGRLCKVQLGNGERGWLECRYISDEKPARAMLVEAQARASRLRDEVNALTRQLEASRQHKEALELRLQAAERLLSAQASKPDMPTTGSVTVDSRVAWTVDENTPDTSAETTAEGTSKWLFAGQGAAAGCAVAALAFYWRRRKKHNGLGI